MNTVTFFLLSLVMALTGCVSIKSNTRADAIPPTFHRVLIVTKMRKAPDSYVQRYAKLFPAGYEVCTLALSPLSFDKPDEAIRKQVENCHSEVILMIELISPGSTSRYGRSYYSKSYEYNADMQSVASGQSFWKAIISSNADGGEQVSPASILRRLQQDHIITGAHRAGTNGQVAN